MNSETLEQIEIFVCRTNTDLTEGRGWTYPFAWADSESTADRLASKKGVMGSDASITKEIGYRRNGIIYGPVRIERATDADKAKDTALASKRAALEKARAVGLTDDEIKAIQTRF